MSKNYSKHRLWYQSPAMHWEEALPLGNGRMGAMVFGGVKSERFQLNEDTLWAGLPRQIFNKDALGMLPKARELIRDRKFTEASEFVTKMCDSGGGCQPYQTAGDLLIKSTFADSEEIHSYERDLDLDTAIAGLSFSSGEKSCKRESFISAIDQVLAIQFSSSTLGSCHCAFHLDSPMKHEVSTQNDDLVLTGWCPVKKKGADLIAWEENGNRGVRYIMQVRSVVTGGTVRLEGQSKCIENADTVMLLVAIQTSFDGYDQMPGSQGRDLSAECTRLLDSAEQKGWDRLKADHIADHQRLYHKVELDLGTTENDTLPTDTRIKNCHDPADDPGLISLLFHYGRYLLIACSRPGTQAANLQGIWNDQLTPAWASNYTTNINTEMNYWPAETCNLSECVEPLLVLIDGIADRGRDAARNLYGYNGWCSHHNCDLWRFVSPSSGSSRYSFWPAVGAWLCQHIWEHYQFTGHISFLRERGWPTMRGAVEFFLDFLIEDENGYLVTSPSTSPENAFVDPGTGEIAFVCEGSAMDLSVVRELFTNAVSVCTILACDKELLHRVTHALPRIRPHKIGSEGQLLEYSDDFEESETTHRHTSHLYGVFPGCEMTPDTNRDLWEAARISLDRRGTKTTGWAMGWRVALRARLLDGEGALSMMGNLLTWVDAGKELHRMKSGGGVYGNLFDAHPPFQIDGNFGVTAGIAEMLLQSHRGFLHLLPALPAAWKSGKIRGLRARGGYEVDLRWTDGILEEAVIHGKPGSEMDICYGETLLKITINNTGRSVFNVNEQ